jgi:hypothetical protein
MAHINHKYLPHYTTTEWELWEGKWELIAGIYDNSNTICSYFESQPVYFRNNLYSSIGYLLS